MKRNKNPLNFFTRAEVDFFEKPMFTGQRWIGFKENDYSKVLLTRSRCAALGYPVGDTEEATAYRYVVKGPGERKYVPVYDRTSYNIAIDKLYEKEIYQR